MPRADITPDDLRDRVGERIRELAKRRKVSLNALAEDAGISRAMFYRVLKGQTPATTDTLAKLAKALRVDPMELLRPPARPKATDG